MRIAVPGAYLYKMYGPRWDIVLYGIRRSFLSLPGVIDFAKSVDDVHCNSDVLELLGVRFSADMTEIIERLVSTVEPSDDQKAADAWMCAAVSYIYEHRTEFTDPWEI